MKRRASFLALGAAAATLLALPAANAGAQQGTACRFDPSQQAQTATHPLRRLFDDYGNSNRRLDDWTGGDNTVSVRLPDGRTAWIFADTFLDRVNADGSRSEEDFINNSIVLQRGNRLVRTLRGGTARDWSTLIQTDDGHQADGKSEVGDSFYWANGATIDGGKLQVFVNKYWMYSNELFGFEWLGNAIATFSLPRMKLESVRQIVSADGVTWGSTVVDDGGWKYVYGNRNQALMLARARAGDLLGRWQYWTGSGWSIRFKDSQPLFQGVGTAVGIEKAGDAWVLITFDNRGFVPAEIVAYSSCSLTGPWGDPAPVYRTPETGGNIFAYDARLHPQFTRNGRLVLSYNVNSFSYPDLMRDVSIYRPRFLELTLPRLIP